MHVNWGMTAQEISSFMGGHPSRRCIDSMIDQYNRDGKTLPLKGNRGVKHADRKLEDSAKQALIEFVADDPRGIMLHELAVKLEAETQQQWNLFDVCRALKEMDYVRLRSFKHAVEADRPSQARRVCR
jgi:transposase